jgi:hypothetical protein
VIPCINCPKKRRATGHDPTDPTKDDGHTTFREEIVLIDMETPDVLAVNVTLL